MGTNARIVTYLLGAAIVAIALRLIVGPAAGLANSGSMYADAKLGGGWTVQDAITPTLLASRAWTLRPN